MLKTTFDIGDNVTYKHPLDGVFAGANATVAGKIVDLDADSIKVSFRLGTLGDPRVAEIWTTADRLISDTHIADPNRITRQLAAAEKIAHKDWSDYLFDEGHDKYFDSFDDLLEDYENEDDEDIPNWAWATKSKVIKIDRAIDLIDSAIEDLSAEEIYEATDFVGIAELQQAIDTFNALNQAKIVYDPDYTKAIIFSEDESK